MTREQAIGTGFGLAGINRMVRSGQWRRISSGSYFTAPIDPSWMALVWAGVLIGGDAARIGGLAAAHLHGLAARPPGQILVLVSCRGAPPSVAGPWWFRRERPGARLARTVGAPPRLTVEDTVLDLFIDPHGDVRVAVSWVTTAMQSRLTTVDQLRRAAAARHFLPRRRLLAELLGDVAAGVRSILELDYLRNVERAHGLPAGRRQVRRRNTEADVLYDEYALLVELDGRRGHIGSGKFRDLLRDNAATSDGLAALRYGYGDVADVPCEVAWQVGGNLIQRGWPGPIARCDRCRRVA